MKGISRTNLDLDIILSREEVSLGSKCPGREFPILVGDLFDEDNKRIGQVKLQKTATFLSGTNVEEKADVYFIETNKSDKFIQLGFSAYYDLQQQGSLMRRIPFYQSQLLITVREELLK